MPSVELFLPPRPYSIWRRRRAASNGFVAALRLLATWIERARQRQALAALDDRALRDIGVTRAEAARECDKPFWK